MTWDRSALELESGAELVRFDLGQVRIGATDYTVLTGYERPGLCFWCGAALSGKRAAKGLTHFCRGHGVLYRRHFEWGPARAWCIERQEGICANCGRYCKYETIEVHHIVPVDGGQRFYTAYNLPWNLIGLCHKCHQEVHAAMRPPHVAPVRISERERLIAAGQGVLL